MRILKMSFSRGFISGMLTVSAVFGIYIFFFDHPPATETLEVNAHHHGREKLAPPKSLDFGPPKLNLGEGNARHILSKDGGEMVKRTEEKGSPDQEFRPDDVIYSKTQRPRNSLDKKVDIDEMIDTIDQPDRFKDESSPHVKPTPKRSGEQQNSAEPTNPTNIFNGRDAAKDSAHNEAKNENVKSKPVNVGRTDGLTHLNFPRFDWDKWVKDNELVDVGSIWGYCDDPDPLPTGKMLLMKDEDRGGLKVVLVLNTTFDEPIESGLIIGTVMYGEVKFIERSLDICTIYEDDEPEPGEERDTFFDCPMASGLKYYVKELHVPIYVPSGHFTVKAKMTDHMERTILCAVADLTL